MKHIIVLIVIGIAIVVDTSNTSDETEETTKIEEDGIRNETHQITTTNKPPEEKRMRPVFPKTTQKFTVALNSTKTENVSSPVNRTSKMPVFKIIPKAVKINRKNYWKTTTSRPPLMKYTKFTVGPLTSFKKHKDETSHEDDSSEEVIESAASKEKRKDKVKRVKSLAQRYNKLSSKIRKANDIDNISKSNKNVDKLKDHKGDVTDKNKTSSSEFSSEEKEDGKEFIFVNQKKRNDTEGVTEDNDESVETTTLTSEKESKPRQERSINVIEEENLGTTVSGFKFTGKVASLSSDLVFRNINV